MNSQLQIKKTSNKLIIRGLLGLIISTMHIEI